MVFRIKDTDTPVLVVASGVNRVDEKAVARLLSARNGVKVKLARADADFVRATSGYAIGGVPPVAHTTPPVTLIDRDLLEFEMIWCAAGTPNAVFEIPPADLIDLSSGTIADIKKQ